MSNSERWRWRPRSGTQVYEVDWSEAEDAKLRSLFEKGLSESLIGVELNRTKNSVHGRIRRLNLPPRKPAIRAAYPKQPNRKPRQEVIPMPLQSLRVVAAPKPVMAAPVKRALPPPIAPTHQCQWVTCMGKYGRGWLFCDAHSVGSWCPTHRAVVFQPVMSWRRELAA